VLRLLITPAAMQSLTALCCAAALISGRARRRPSGGGGGDMQRLHTGTNTS